MRPLGRIRIDCRAPSERRSPIKQAATYAAVNRCCRSQSKSVGRKGYGSERTCIGSVAAGRVLATSRPECRLVKPADLQAFQASRRPSIMTKKNLQQEKTYGGASLSCAVPGLPRASAARLRTRSYRGALAGFDITGTQNFIAYGKLRRRGAEIARSEVASEGTADGSVRLSQS